MVTQCGGGRRKDFSVREDCLRGSVWSYSWMRIVRSWRFAHCRGWDRGITIRVERLWGGIGLVCGVACVVLANVPTINGGTINPPSMMRSGRLGQIAIANRLPMIRLTEVRERGREGGLVLV